MIDNKALALQDKEAYEILQKERRREEDNIELIASENFVSMAVREANGSIFTNKYAEGYPGRRYYGGCEYIDRMEVLAIERLKKLFNCQYANVQPHSGSSANMEVYQALLNHGDRILGMSLDAGGHLTHGYHFSFSGKEYESYSYGVDEKTGLIDYDNVLKIAREVKPKMIICGASAYPRIIDFKKFREITDDVGALLMVDMAHIAGLVAAGLHQNPVPYADVVTTTTHKTLRGPRGGMILCRAELAQKINKAIFPGTQGGPLMHIIAAKAVCFGEALKPEFVEYQKRIVSNAAALADELLSEGFDLVSGGTDNHLMLVDLRPMNITGKELERRLDEVYITANKNTIPNDPQSPFITSGIRLGTPAVTTRGFTEEDMRETAHLIKLAATDFEASADNIRSRVTALCEKHPLY